MQFHVLFILSLESCSIFPHGTCFLLSEVYISTALCNRGERRKVKEMDDHRPIVLSRQFDSPLSMPILSRPLIALRNSLSYRASSEPDMQTVSAKVTDQTCRLPSSTLFYRLEASHGFASTDRGGPCPDTLTLKKFSV